MRKNIPVQNHSLRNAVDVGSICGTTTFNADRKRYLSGIFLSQIPINGSASSFGHTLSFIEFAVRATRRNKTGNRTNNADCLKAVVEPLPPLVGGKFIHKLTRTFKMKTYQKLTALLAAFPTPVLSSTQGGANV
ncbi:hypothetical protein BKK47_09960 [Rodentibacter mrazii]|uniref:Uncharacterized protein n=1 Tax=Rodentibacter mrazii TaxID=1908257 RepID=A0A1V3ICU3_9PAST|nr:hypothetical protein [Rodentibacter mrazii]OOF38199.1 hypothetical protein BKK47_09960 [Rodentibacter mrazii]